MVAQKADAVVAAKADAEDANKIGHLRLEIGNWRLEILKFNI